MSSLAMAAVTHAGFALTPSLEGGKVVLRVSGNADMNTQAVLAAALRQVHAEAVRLGVVEVVCDFGELYFMSSSCFKAFVAWVTLASSLDPVNQYRIRIRSNRQLGWQRRSVEALRCLAEKIVFVES